MFLVLRYAFLVLFLATVVSLIPMFIPDPKSSDRRFHLYVGSVVAAGVIVCSLFQALAPMGFKVIGEKDEVVETHSLVTLKTDSCLSGSSSLLFGYLTEEDVYVLMVRQDDGGYRRKCYSADSGWCMRMRMPTMRGSIWSSAIRQSAVPTGFLS